MSLAPTGFELMTNRTRKREFLDEMSLVIPWTELLSLIAPHAPEGKTGRPPFAIEVMLRIHLLQQFFGHSDPAMEEALHDIPLYRELAHLDACISRLPDESTVLRFRHLLEAHEVGQQILATVNAKLIEQGLMLKTGTVVDATLIAAPSSTKNEPGERDPEMRQRPRHHAGTRTAAQINQFLSALAVWVEPVTLHYVWRPQLRDPGDEMVLEAAVNARVDALVTHNVRDFSVAAPRFGLLVMTPAQALTLLKETP